MATHVQSLITLLQRGVVTGGDVDELWGSFLGAFSASCGALTQSWGFNDINSGRDVPDAWIRDYMRLRHTDPFAAQLAVDPPGTPGLIAHDSLPACEHTELWQTFQAHGFADGMNARVYNPFVSDLFVIFYREKGRPRFSEAERTLFHLLYPHLASGLAARRALAALSADADETLPAALEAVSGYVYLSLPSGEVSWSLGARELWRRRLDVVDNEGLRRAERVLVDSARRFHTATIGGRSQLVLPGIRIEWASVPPRKYERRRLLGLMFAEGPHPNDEPSPAELLLSRQQRTVARLAAGGAGTKAIAETMQLKVSTVRGYLREIYGRLGISSRAQLATLLAQRPVALERAP